MEQIIDEQNLGDWYRNGKLPELIFELLKQVFGQPETSHYNKVIPGGSIVRFLDYYLGKTLYQNLPIESLNKEKTKLEHERADIIT